MDSSQIDEILSKNKNEVTSDELAQAAAVVDLDIGHLMAFDPRPLDSAQIKKNKTEYIKEICTMSTQLLLNKLFNLPTERVEDVVIAKLPNGVTVFPREKPLPKEKRLTKWEQYAKLKGIKKTKKSRKVFDETTQEWRPRWGYKRANDSTKDWLIEIKKNQDPNEDHFAKRTQEKTERSAKNELQRLRNIARASKKKVPGVGLTPNSIDEKNPDKFAIKKALSMAKRADASMSKFSEKVKSEDKVTKGLGRKRKFESNYGDMKNEKEKQLKLFDKMSSNKQKVNTEKAANKFISDENNENASKKGHKKGKKRSASGKPRAARQVKGKRKK